MDGANVEIVDEVGAENAFIFGMSSEEVINYENNGGYHPYEIYQKDKDIHEVLDQLVDGTYAMVIQNFTKICTRVCYLVIQEARQICTSS